MIKILPTIAIVTFTVAMISLLGLALYADDMNRARQQQVEIPQESTTKQTQCASGFVRVKSENVYVCVKGYALD